MSAIAEAIRKVGGATRAAEVCGLKGPRAVYKWLAQESLPRTEYTGETRYAEMLADASGGAFSAQWLLDQANPAHKGGSPGEAVA